MKKAFFFGAIIILFAACAEDTPNDKKDGLTDVAKSPEDSLFQEVMNGHDVAMAKMIKLPAYKKEIQQRLDSLKKVKSSAKASLEQLYGKLDTELKEAEDHMNTWMHEFSIDSAQDDIKRRLTYLESEKAKVNKVKDEMLQAVSRADSLLKK